MCRVSVVTLCICLGACGSRGPQVSTTGSTHHKIPGDPTPLTAAFAEGDGRHGYIVLAYGRDRGMQAGLDHVVVDGQRMDVPPTGKVYVLDPQLKLHESRVRPADLIGPLWAGGEDEFFKTYPWQGDLYPLLKMHRWSSDTAGK